jgi:hypothetical protein
MDLPGVPNKAYDRGRNITFIVMADRQLTPKQLELVVRTFCANNKVKKNKTYQIVMTPGAFDRGPFSAD